MSTNTHAHQSIGQQSHVSAKNLWKGPAVLTAVILVIPILGNHFVEGWNWRPSAFVVLGILLFVLGLSYQLLTRNKNAVAYRAALGIAITASFLLTWGSLVQWADVNPDAALYFSVPVIAAIGAAIARFQPRGMSRALFTTALTQLLIFAFVLGRQLLRNPEIAFWTPPELRGFIGNIVVALLFVSSALLFRKAARTQSAAGEE